MKTFYLSTLLLLISSFAKAQAVYLDSLQNAFSINAAIGKYEDVISKSVGIGYTFNSTFNIGLSYLSGNFPYEGQDYDGSGYGFSVSLTAASEARGNLIGADIGFFFTNVVYTGNLPRKDIETNSFGIGIFFTERLTKKHSPQSVLFQFGVSTIPISEAIVYQGDILEESIISPLQIQLHFSPTLKFGNRNNGIFVVEPVISHEVQYNITVFSIGVQVLF